MKMVRCDFPGCNKSFDRASKLNSHKRIHAPRTHECALCSQKFHSTSRLKRHEETHNENRERLFCEIEDCNSRRGSMTGVGSKTALDRHMKMYHSDLTNSQPAERGRSSRLDQQAENDETMADDPDEDIDMLDETLQPKTSRSATSRASKASSDAVAWNQGQGGGRSRREPRAPHPARADAELNSSGGAGSTSSRGADVIAAAEALMDVCESEGSEEDRQTGSRKRRNFGI